MNPPSHKVHQSAIVVAIVLMAGFNTAKSQYCAGQELPAPAQAPATTAPESLPDGAQLNGAQLPEGCDVPSDTPLFALTTDIQPRIDGKPVPNQNLPVSCSKSKFVPRQTMSIDLSCNTCRPGYCDLLSMAR